MENGMENSNGNVRKGKSVRFSQEPQVFFFKQGSVRERARRYDQNVKSWLSAPPLPRPPALPPRNPVTVNQVGPKPLPPKPPPRAKKDSTFAPNVCLKVRTFRRIPDVRPVTLGGEIVPLQVPDKPPPPPPSIVSLVPSAAAKPSTPSTSSTPSVDADDDEGIRLADDQRYNAEDEVTTATERDGDKDSKDRPGCFTGFSMFIVGCLWCFT